MPQLIGFKTVICILILLLVGTFLATCQVQLVKDIVADANYTVGSYPLWPVDVNGVVYFPANDANFGLELYKSDGTHEGTVLVKDIHRGQSSSFPQFITAFGNITLFNAGASETGAELWKTDGTSSGTMLVKDISPGFAESSPFDLIVFKGFVYFSATNATTGRELWRSDGTEGGTVMIKDINPGPADAFGQSMTNFTAMGDWLYFNANDGTGGTELWKSDGTPVGTTLVKDLTPGSASTEFFNVRAIDNTLYFNSNGSGMGYQLWKSDGTEAGTTIVKHSVMGNSSPSEVFKFNGKIYFAANYDGHGWELWQTDGTDAGTVLIKDIYPGPGSSITWTGNNFPTFVVMGSYFYFAADDGINQTQLWKSDGTFSGTVMVKQIHPSFGSFPFNFTILNNTLYFRASGDGISLNLNDELWKSDGTEAGTVVVKEVNPNVGAEVLYIKKSGDLIYFTANDGVTGNELWRSDGTDAGTFITRDLSTGSAVYPRGLASSGNDLVFVNQPSTSKIEIWKSDGSENGTSRLKDTALALEGVPVPNTTFVDGKVYVTIDDVNSGHELWVSDGTEAGTKIVKDIFPGPSSSFAGTNLNHFAHIGNQVIFTADDGVHGTELWRSDGTEAGTMMIKDLDLLGMLTVDRYIVFDNIFYFFDDFKLYRSDGSSLGTYLIKDINPARNGTTSSGDFVVNNGKLYFTADDGVQGLEIWTSDGTEAGTHVLKDIYPNNDFTYAKAMGSLNGTLYLSVNDGVHGAELWKSDGTEVGTVLLKDIDPDGWSLPMNFVAIENTFYFIAGDAEHSRELWKSDGTASGTVLVKDIFAGRPASTIEWLTAFKGLLYFSAEDGTHGSELWRSDGTAAGTYMVEDIGPLAHGSFPMEIIAGEDWLYFSADDGTHGRDIWKFNPAGINVPSIADKVTTDEPFKLDIFSYSGLPVTLTVVAGPATISADNTITLTGSGVVTIKATQAGDGQYAASEVIRSFTVVKATQKITFESISSKTTSDAPFALNAFSSSQLPITFSVTSGPATVSGNTLTLTRSGGVVIVEASQEGNDLYESARVDQTFEVMIVLGIEEQATFNVNIFPNPTTGNISVQLEHGSVTAYLMNTIGEVVWFSNNVNTPSFNLELDGLPKGLYLFQVKDKAETYSRKVVIE